MKKIKRMIIWVLTLSMLFSLVAFAEDKISIEEYTITKPYQYPVVPGTKEWSELDSLDEMIKACQIPEEILSKMSTEALIETVLNYPLAINMFAFNTPQEGHMSVKAYFNGIQELENRSDTIEKMNYRMSNLTEKNKDEVDILIEKVIYTALSSSMTEKEVHETRSETHYNYTPNGTRVMLIYNRTWADNGLTASEANEINERYKAAYPQATPLREENPAYNCHSYAWYSQGAGNLYWMNNSYAYMYMNDGSYTRTTSPVSGNKVWYGSADHSAIYVSSTSVKSKWGTLGLYQHAVNYCPYGANEISYWKR